MWGRGWQDTSQKGAAVATVVRLLVVLPLLSLRVLEPRMGMGQVRQREAGRGLRRPLSAPRGGAHSRTSLCSILFCFQDFDVNAKFAWTKSFSPDLLLPIGKGPSLTKIFD